MKVCIIGGGSTYTPELINGFIERQDHFPVTELWLMDIDQARLEIVGGLAQRMILARGAPIQVHLSLDLKDSIAGSNYVVTQFRVGQMKARREDEYLGMRHQLVGQETTGVGGMAKALRTIPVILEIADTIRKYSPGAMLVNFTNPSGLITQALSLHAPDVTSVGVCNAPLTTKMHILDGLQRRTGRKIDPIQAELDTLGLNHLTWHRGFKVDGEDIWQEVLQGFIEDLKAEEQPMWAPEFIHMLGMIPNYYLEYYYYTSRMVENQHQWPPSRAEAVMEVEKVLLRQYADPTCTRPPDDLLKRGGAYYSTAATQLMSAHYNDLGEIHVVNTRHHGAVAGWPADWVLEMPCVVDRKGIHPLKADPLPEFCFGLISQVKAYELLTIQAAVSGDRSAAFKALLAHPLGPDLDRVPFVLDDMLQTNREYLPFFWK